MILFDNGSIIKDETNRMWRFLVFCIILVFLWRVSFVLVCMRFRIHRYVYSSAHIVGRVLSFFSSRRNWESPDPSPAGECAPPPPPRERGWESSNSDEGTYTLVLFIYLYFVAAPYNVHTVHILSYAIYFNIKYGVRVSPSGRRWTTSTRWWTITGTSRRPSATAPSPPVWPRSAAA